MKLYCKVCGQELEENQMFCANCGTPREDGASFSGQNKMVPPGQIPAGEGYYQNNISTQNGFSQQGNVPPQNSFYQQGNIPPQNGFSQQGNVLPQDSFYQQGNVPPQNSYYQQDNIPSQNNIPPQYNAPQQGGYYTQGNASIPQNSYMPQNMMAPKKKNKYALPIGIAIGAVVFIGAVVVLISQVYKALVPEQSNLASSEAAEVAEVTEESSEESSALAQIETADNEDAEAVDPKYVPEDYAGPYDYFNGDSWVVPVEGMFVSSSGYVNSKYLGDAMAIAQSTDLSSALVLTKDGFRYINKDAADVDFAPDAQCADIAVRGKNMFYVIPTEKVDDYELADLYIMNMENGKSNIIAKSIVRSTPVISPNGIYVAYTRYYSKDKAVEMFIGGDNVTEEKVESGMCHPICISDEKKMFYVKEGDPEICAFDSHNTRTLIRGAEVKQCFINSKCDELVVNVPYATFYYNFELENDAPTQLCDAEITGAFTDCLNQVYGQYGNTTFCDVPTLKDIIFSSSDNSVFVISSDGKESTKLDHSISDFSNMIMYNADGKRTMLYSCDGKMYSIELDGDDKTEKVFFDDITVDNFVCSYDLKKVWIVSSGDVCYLDNGKATFVASGIDKSSNPLDTGIVWNIEDNWLYYLKGGALYRVNQTQDSEHMVAEDASILTNIYGKVYYLPASRKNVYLYMNGKFEKVI